MGVGFSFMGFRGSEVQRFRGSEVHRSGFRGDGSPRFPISAQEQIIHPAVLDVNVAIFADQAKGLLLDGEMPYFIRLSVGTFPGTTMGKHCRYHQSFPDQLYAFNAFEASVA